MKLNQTMEDALSGNARFIVLLEVQGADSTWKSAAEISLQVERQVQQIDPMGSLGLAQCLKISSQAQQTVVVSDLLIDLMVYLTERNHWTGKFREYVLHEFSYSMSQSYSTPGRLLFVREICG